MVSDCLNNYFVQDGQDGDSSIAPGSILSKCLVGKSMFLLPTNEEVLDFIESLKSSKSLGRDGISSKVLKAYSMDILTPLTHLVNNSFEGGKFPSLLKTEIVKLIP